MLCHVYGEHVDIGIHVFICDLDYRFGSGEYSAEIEISYHHIYKLDAVVTYAIAHNQLLGNI